MGLLQMNKFLENRQTFKYNSCARQQLLTKINRNFGIRKVHQHIPQVDEHSLT